MMFPLGIQKGMIYIHLLSLCHPSPPQTGSAILGAEVLFPLRKAGGGLQGGTGWSLQHDITQSCGGKVNYMTA